MYIDRFAKVLTVRRMFSLLHYLCILAYPGPIVKNYFSCFQNILCAGWLEYGKKNS